MLVLMSALTFMIAATGFATDMNSARILPEGKVIVSWDGKTIAEYTKEMPVPEGALLTCEGKCAVRMDDILLVAEDQSRFSVDIKNNQRILNVQKGTVYFGLSKMPRTVVFRSPDGIVSADQVFLNASADANMLEGYVMTSEKSSEVGVLSGGSLPLMTSGGVKVLKPGNRFLLAQANMGGAPDSPDKKEGKRRVAGYWNLSNGQIAGIAAGTVAVGGIAYAIKRNNDSGSGHDGSPFKP